MKALQIDKQFTKDYIAHLDSFLSSIQPHCDTFNCYQNSMSAALRKLKGSVSLINKQLRTSKEINGCISISPNIILEIHNTLVSKSGPKLYVCIGGHIDITASIMTNQSISLIVLCDLPEGINSQNAATWRCHEYPAGAHVIRKFHFDIDRAITGNWPISHLQYGGADNSHHVEFEKSISYQLFSPIDTPRIPHPPYSFIICLDIILKCFQTDASRVTKESFWISKVKESEDFWLKPFYQNVVNYLQAGSRPGTLWDYFSSRA